MTLCSFPKHFSFIFIIIIIILFSSVFVYIFLFSFFQFQRYREPRANTTTEAQLTIKDIYMNINTTKWMNGVFLGEEDTINMYSM